MFRTANISSAFKGSKYATSSNIILKSRVFSPTVASTPIVTPQSHSSTYNSYKLFHTTIPLLAKNKKSKKSPKNDEQSPSNEALEIDFNQISEKFEKIIDKFSKKANEIKLGKTNPNMFDNLDIKLSDNQTYKFNSLAQTSIKGRNLMITVFDPSNNQNIINGILNSKLNLNPQLDPHTNMLKVPLPPITTETKQENIKLLKSQFEQFKNSNSNSLNSIRLDYKQKITKKLKQKKSDQEMDQLKQFENLHKEYLDKLTKIFKTNESLLSK